MALLRSVFFCLLCLFSLPLSADFCFPWYGEVGIAYDYFRSLPEGDWEGNTGAFVSANVAAQIPYVCSPGYGVQLGGSYGVYDWQGRLSSPSSRQSEAEQQAFISAGFFKETCCESGFNYGLIYDWMWNKNLGVFAQDADIDQLRFQAGYLSCCRNEWGLWGTLDLHWSRHESQGIDVIYRAISQINLFWRHIFENSAETVLWAGVPYKRTLKYSTGRAGKFIIGGSFKAPLSCRLGIEGHACYMRPHSASGAYKQRNYAANLCLELKWALNGTLECIRPYMPIGNNNNFLVDTNINF